MIRAVAAAALLIAIAPAARAQNVGEYLALARTYAAGDGAGAERRLATWSRADLVAAGRAAAVTATTGDLLAAAMLHTDFANTIVDTQKDAADFHVAQAEWLLGIARGESPQAGRLDNGRARTFSSRWFRFVASMYTSCNRPGDAARYMNFGLVAFPEDPQLYVARGILLEVRALTFAPDTRRGRRDEAIEDGLKPAAANFLHALAIDAHNAEAHLHLGWVHMITKDRRAEAELETALAAAADDTVRYLARLMLGGLAEREQRYADARREYAAAREIGPAYQTPYLALSRIDEALGERERAREEAATALQLNTSDDDPRLDLRIGFDRESLRWLRREARKP